MTNLVRAATAVGVVLAAAMALAPESTPEPMPVNGTVAATAAARPVTFGAYVDGMTDRPFRLRGFERGVRARMGVASYYYGFGDVFPGALERRFADAGRRSVLVSWHLDNARFERWAEGRFDRYLSRIAVAARAYPYDLYVRPWAEMNGDWQRFQPTPRGHKSRGGTYAEFRAAWRHVVTYMRRHGAGNIKWVFNPSADVYPGTTPVRAIWPGRRFVDVLGIDGYNWGRDASWGRWRSYPRIFAPMYRRLVRLHPSAPVWICEFGSKEPARHDGSPVDRRHSKAVWLRRALTYDGFPRVRAMVYFHARKERDWRVHSSSQALRVTRRTLDLPQFVGLG